MILRSILLKLAENKRLTGYLARKGMATGLARRFVAGETLEEAVGEIQALNEQGILATFDLLGENVSDEKASRDAVETYKELLDRIEKLGLKANVSLKLTQLGLDLSQELCVGNMRQILGHAQRYENFVRIDMEGSPYTQKTLDVLRALWSEYKNVGVVIQAYLYRSAQDIEDLMALGARVRLCKGAYKEPRHLAFPKKKDVDANFKRLATRLLEAGKYPAIATHDPAMIEHVFEEAKRVGRDASTFEFQMLYGIRPTEQVRLKDAGHPMRVYVPYGSQWLPYFMRRIAERPANAFFVLKNLFRR